jgi:hypothetical protein
MPKNKKSKGKKLPKEVPLNSSSILDGRCTMLVPGPITNSGETDGGWMDRIGITAVGLGKFFEPPNAIGPIDLFYSNDAYSKYGFCTMQVELHPPLETIGDTSTRESLQGYLEGHCRFIENDHYGNGDYVSVDVPRIDDPSSIGSSASMIVHFAFEVPITQAPGANIPQGLTATTFMALVHFANRGNVLFKATNFERHSPPMDYDKMLASIAYTVDSPYLGPDPNFSGYMGMLALLRSGGNLDGALAAMARAQSEIPVERGVAFEPTDCLKCGAKSAPAGGPLLTCSRCQCAAYCSQKCQRADWKRHKRSECREHSS